MKLRIKRLLCLTLAICILLFNVTCYAAVLSIPEPPIGNTGNKGIVLYSSTYNRYYYIRIDYNLDYANPIVVDDVLIIDNIYAVNDCYFFWYKLIDGEWVLPDSTLYYSLPNISSYTVISSSEDINYRGGGTFFQQAESQPLAVITTPMLLETLRTMIVGLIPLLAPLLIGSAGLWIALRWLLKNLRKA